jgi:hypothetical protein
VQQLPRRSRKGAARREKDCATAEKHQAGFKPEKSAESADILLPFRGRILPLAHDDQVEVTVPVTPTPPLVKNQTISRFLLLNASLIVFIFF